MSSHPHHHPSHSHGGEITHLHKAFIFGIAINLAFVVIEFTAGFLTNSLALLSDAGHNLGDVATLALSLLAFKIASRKATAKYTFGFHKGTILASLANSIILLVAVGSIGWEAVRRFMEPVETEGKVISIVSGIGILVNALSALLFLRDKERDLNAKGAYLHLALDAFVSLGVVVAGLLISFTGLKWIDPLISLVIMLVVTYSTWGLLTESLTLSLDAVPRAIDVERVKEAMQKATGVLEVHHLHIWAMSTSRNALTAHLVLEPGLSDQQTAEIKHKLKHQLEHLNIHHATLETETTYCRDLEC